MPGRISARRVQPTGSDNQDQVLKGLESGEIKLDGGVDSKTFFAMLLQNTKEGYFSDPIYGGNKGLGAWKMIGFRAHIMTTRNGCPATESVFPTQPWASKAVRLEGSLKP